MLSFHILGDGLDVKRDLRMLQEQVDEMKSESSVSRRRALGVKYGLSDNLDTPVFDIPDFDMTKYWLISPTFCFDCFDSGTYLWTSFTISVWGG